jgi:hypothetical protein
MLAIMIHTRFKDLSILSNYVGIKKTAITIAKYDSKTLIPFLCSTYQKVYPFTTKHPSNYRPENDHW